LKKGVGKFGGIFAVLLIVMPFLLMTNVVYALPANTWAGWTASGSPEYMESTVQPEPVLLETPAATELTLLETRAANQPMDLPVGFPLQSAVVVATFVTDKSVWSNHSPDPSGIVYLPTPGHFIIVDSEIDEFDPVGAWPNVFYTTLNGTFLSSTKTYSAKYFYLKETTGITFNPVNNHLFISDDDRHFIVEVTPGIDGIYWTEDDNVALKNLGINGLDLNADEEDVAYGANQLFIAGGSNGEFLKFDLGQDGIISPDDGLIVRFQVNSSGFSDIEGIFYNEAKGTLFLISTAATQQYLGEFTTEGVLLNAWDLSAMGNFPNIRSGLTFAPGSLDPLSTHAYIVSRGIDNNVPSSTPAATIYEDDGKVWEFSIDITPSPTPPPIHSVYLPILLR